MRWRPSIVAAVLAGACAGTPVPPAAVPVSSWRDPSVRSPLPSPGAGASDAPVGAIVLGGAENARALVVTLLEAIRDDDAEAAERTLAERVESAAPLRAEAPRSTVDRHALVRHWLTLARSAHIEPDAPLAAIVVGDSITVEPASLFYAPGERPQWLADEDLVVRFGVTDAGRRAFAGLAPGGEGTIVVRPGPAPRIVGR